MYSLLIIDDEPIITDGLYDLLQEISDPELDIYKAYCGIEALEIMKKTKIDIVMSDICMPDMTGIEIQKEIRLQWPRCKVIFLTGFNEFDYVQSAIRNDGFDYILKTEGDDVILQAVKKAISAIDREMENEQLIEKAKINMDMAIPFLQSKYLMDLLEGIEYSREEREIRFAELEIPLSCKQPVLLLIGCVDIWPDGLGITERMKILYGVQNIAEEYLSKSADIVTLVHEHSKLLWLIQPSDENKEESQNAQGKLPWDRLVPFVHGTMDSIQQACKQLFKISASFVVSIEPVLWEKVSEQYDSLLLTINKTAGFNNEMLLIDDSSMPDDELDGKNTLQHRDEYSVRSQLKKISLLEAFLESGQRDEFLELYTSIKDSVKKSKFISYDLVKEAYYSIALLFLSYFNRWKVAEKADCPIDLDKLMKIESHSSWEEIVAYFQRLAEYIFDQKRDDYFKSTNRIIGFIKNYTEQHIDGDISLTKLAELLHFNPSYLSRLYKKVTGKSLSEYITEVKVYRAREMLKQNNLKINEISTALGFETASYFTRFFKKCTNLSPQEYRDSLKE